MTNPDRPLTLLVCALGGEGGGVLTEWLVETARHAGYAAQATSIPGVAQRTGATTYYLEVFPVPMAQLGGRKPVFSLSPVPGALDALVSSELLETARQIGNGMASPDRTLVLSSTARMLTTQERMQLADGRVEAAELMKLLQAFSREHQVFDMNAVARECGTVVSSVLLGAIAGSGLLPFERRFYEEAVRGGVPHEKANASAQASLRGFARAFEIVSGRKQQAAFVSQVLQGVTAWMAAFAGMTAHRRTASHRSTPRLSRRKPGSISPSPCATWRPWATRAWSTTRTAPTPTCTSSA